MRSFGFVLGFVVCSFAAASADAATKPGETSGVATFEAYCKQAKATSDAAKLRAISDRLNEDRTKLDEHMELAEAGAKEAASALEGLALQYQAKLDVAIKDLDKKMAAARAERTRLGAVMEKERKGPAFDQAFRERNAKFDEIEALDKELEGKKALRGVTADAMAVAALTDDRAKKAAAIQALVPQLDTAGMATFALPGAHAKSADALIEDLKKIWDAAWLADECVGDRIVAVDAAKDEAKDAEAKYLLDQAVTLGKKMEAKGKAMAAAEKAARDLWATVESLDDMLDSPAIEQATNAYLAAMNEYLAIGIEFRAAVEQLTRKGGALEPWMTQLDTRYEKVKAEAKKLKASLKRGG